MTELSFLISLILDDDLPPKHKKICADRIKDIEQNIQAPPIVRGSAQSASTQKILDEMATNPQPVPQVIPNTMMAAQALQSRQDAIRAASKGEVTNGRGGPRKF